MPEIDSESPLNRLAMLGSLTGAAAHELNNILGILSLRLEKLQSDLPGPAAAVSGPAIAAHRDLQVMEKNLDRAVAMVGLLQQVLRPGPDRQSATDVAQAIDESLEVLRSIYEKKVNINLNLAPAKMEPGLVETLQLFVVSAVHRVILGIGYGSSVEVRFTAHESSGGILEIEGRSASGGQASLPASGGALPGVLDALLDRLRLLARQLTPDPLQFEADAGSPDDPARIRSRIRVPLAGAG
jgi:signal transduction histidine kinase